MKTTSYALLAALLFSTVSFAGLENIYVEQYVHDGTEVGGPGAGYITYRIFAQTSSAQNEVLAIMGEDGFCITDVSTSTQFWNYLGTPYSGSLTGKECVYVEGVSDGILYDSYVTIGYSSSNTLGIPISDDPTGNTETNSPNNILLAGTWSDAFNNGESILLDGLFGGLWGTTSGAGSTLPLGADNSVLIGNFTTDGYFSFHLNVNVLVSGVSTLYSHCNYSDLNLAQEFSSQCTDELACNYNPDAIEDNGSCYFIQGECDDSNPFTFNDTYDENCECSGMFQECTDAAACNFGDPIINEEGCKYAFDLCDDFNPNTVGDAYNVDCDCVGVVSGCMDELACNYDLNAQLESGDCLFSEDDCSQNYFGELNENCSCEYSLNGVVFIDNNFNQYPDWNEGRLSLQSVTIVELGLTQITNSGGRFSFQNIPEGTYELSINYSDEWDNYSTPIIYSVSVPQDVSDEIRFGVTNSEEPSMTGYADLYQFGGIPCNDLVNYLIYFRNNSPFSMSGVIEMQIDELLSLNIASETIDSIVGQTAYWSFTDLNSYESISIFTGLNSPDETNIGEFVTNTLTMKGWHDGELIPIAESTVTREVTCAYDPNDITGIPAGYTDDHLVLPDTRMEYLIRFQNTGNAPAGQVMVVDTLDADMDPSTFQLVANSHSVMTTIHPSGRVEFLFENINLPDSTENEPESHGLVSFKIDFRDDVSIGEEVNSTAHIFFDNNPAVVTNTTWHTIHECGGEADFEASATEICRGETVTFTGTSSLVEEHAWNVDAAPSGAESAYSSEFTEAGDYIIQLVAENPLCNASTMQMITVYDLPEAEITESGAILISNEGAFYQWYMNGEAIDSATEQTYEALDDGSYSVEVTNENGCSTLSSSVMIVNIEELTTLKLELFPNPMQFNSTLTFDSSREKTIRLTDPQGKLIRTWSGITDQTVEIKRGTLTAGKYYITVEEGGKTSTIALVVR